jgi:hypothetical protein
LSHSANTLQNFVEPSKEIGEKTWEGKEKLKRERDGGKRKWNKSGAFTDIRLKHCRLFLLIHFSYIS